MAFAVKFPKAVQLENFRLALLYYLVMLVFVAFVGWQFWVNQGYLTARDVNGNVHFWATNYWSHAIQGVNEADEKQSFCSEPEKYNYCDTPDCEYFHFKDIKCMDICTGGKRRGCFPSHSRWFKEDTGVFLPTYFNETIQINPADEALPPTESNKQVFVKGVDEISIAFDHEYYVDNLLLVREHGLSKETYVTGGSHKDGLMTIWVDEDGNEIARWQPGDTIELRVSQILETSGVTLSTINSALGQNFAPGAQIKEGVLTRMSGVSVTVQLQYQNHAETEAGLDLGNHQGPLCILTVFADTPWVSKPIHYSLDAQDSTMQRYYYGIRFSFQSSGRFVWADIYKVITLATTVLVWIGFAQKIVYFFALYGLGALSRVYRRVLVQPLKLQTEVTGLAARLISVSESFRSLEDTKQGISKGRMYRRFRQIFKATEELNEREIKRFVQYVYETMCGDSQDGVSVEEYSDACSTNEPLTFQNLVSIFDSDRKKGCLEKMFADDSVRALFQNDDMFHGESDPMSNASKSSLNLATVDLTKDGVAENLITQNQEHLNLTQTQYLELFRADLAKIHRDFKEAVSRVSENEAVIENLQAENSQLNQQVTRLEADLRERDLKPSGFGCPGGSGNKV